MSTPPASPRLNATRHLTWPTTRKSVSSRLCRLFAHRASASSQQHTTPGGDKTRPILTPSPSRSIPPSSFYRKLSYEQEPFSSPSKKLSLWSTDLASNDRNEDAPSAKRPKSSPPPSAAALSHSELGDDVDDSDSSNSSEDASVSADEATSHVPLVRKSATASQSSTKTPLPSSNHLPTERPSAPSTKKQRVSETRRNDHFPKSESLLQLAMRRAMQQSMTTDWEWIGSRIVPHDKHLKVRHERRLSDYYSAVQFSALRLQVHDGVYLQSDDRSRIPYIAQIKALFQDRGSKIPMASIRWMMRPEETRSGRLPQHGRVSH